MKTIVIVPTYNEKENVEKIVKEVIRIGRTVKNHDVGVLVVDDNSPDGTADIVKKMQKKIKNLYLITGKKEGLGRAYLRGMNYAVNKLDAEIMFEMDADFQHDPELIPEFLKKIDEGNDLVIGSRYIPGGSIPANWGIHRIILSVLGNWIVRTALLNFKHHDWTTGYRAIRTPLYKKVRKELEDFKGYTFQVSFLHKAFLQGAKVAETPIHFKDRVLGESKIGGEYVINLLKYLLMTNIQNPPRQLRFLIVGGTGFLVQSTTFAILKEFVLPVYFDDLGKLIPVYANIIGAVLAITSNFILNNFWTFSDRKKQISPTIVFDYLKFMLFSSGSIAIQSACIWIATHTFGLNDLSEWGGFIVGVLLGLIWNYTMYNKVIWRKKE